MIGKILGNTILDLDKFIKENEYSIEKNADVQIARLVRDKILSIKMNYHNMKRIIQ